jgi:type IV pilus assembly protein PilC
VSAYVYRAVAASGQLVRGQLAAASESELDALLLQTGLQLIDCRPLRRGRARAAGARVSCRELINFCFHLGQAHQAGLPILEALRDLRDSTGNPAFRDVLASLALAVEGGRGLSEAMAAFPATFDRVFVSLVRAGEQSGELSAVLEQMTASLKWQDELLAQTRRLTLYPAFVATVVLAVVAFLMAYVVPQMSEFLKNMGQDMPLHTRALVATSAFVTGYWPLLVVLPVVLVIGLRLLVRRNARARLAFDRFKLRAWFVGPILEKIVMSRFITYFQIMYASGITVVEALKTSRELAGNAVVADALARAHGFVEQGNSLSSALARAELFPPLVLRMVKMGEDVGQLEQSLLNVTYFYNREVKESVERLQSMIEPAMTVVLGLILGWVMLAVLGPIYDTIGRIAM